MEHPPSQRAIIQFLILSLCFAFIHALTAAAVVAQGNPRSLSYQIIHRDAPTSVIKNPAADTSDLPPDMPLKDFIGFGRGLQARRWSTNRGGKVNPSATSRFVSGRFSYLDEAVGDFYLTANVGTPSQKIIFILDTGSELIWTRCSPCTLCTPSKAPVFQPSHSSSYLRIPCTSALCTHSTGVSIDACSNNSANSCIFSTAYGDGSLDAGYLSLDSFTMDSKNRAFLFGCSVIDNETVGPLPSSGIMGLNAGPFSFVSQLVEKGYSKKFGYCPPDRFSAANSSGLIVFGESTVSLASPLSLRYTPLLPTYATLGNLYYYVQVTGISLGKRLLPIPQSTFQVNFTGSGGTILDSGTAITHLLDPAYSQLVKALVTATAHLRPFPLPSASADVCYKVPSNATRLPEIPLITFHFLHGAKLELGTESILYPAAVVRDEITLCLALERTQLSQNIIGNYQQQNYWIEYDLANSRVGFARAKCAVN